MITPMDFPAHMRGRRQSDEYPIRTERLVAVGTIDR